MNPFDYCSLSRLSSRPHGEKEADCFTMKNILSDAVLLSRFPSQLCPPCFFLYLRSGLGDFSELQINNTKQSPFLWLQFPTWHLLEKSKRESQRNNKYVLCVYYIYSIVGFLLEEFVILWESEKKNKHIDLSH